MFIIKPPDEDSALNQAICDVYDAMAIRLNDEEKYVTMVDQLLKLYSLKEINSPMRVSPDTMATVAANLIGIILIVGHERVHVVTSKALSFIMKLR